MSTPALTLTPNHAAKGAAIAVRVSGLPRYKMVRLVYGDVVTAPIKCSWSGVALATITAVETNFVYAEAQTRSKWAEATKGQLTVEAATPVPTPPPPATPPPPPVPPTTPPASGRWAKPRVVSAPPVALPAVGGSYVDPETGLTVIRGPVGFRQDYASRPLWNRDGSLAMVRMVAAPPSEMIVDPCHLLDGRTLADKGKFALYSSGLWSSADADKAYGIDTSAGQLIYNRPSSPTAVRIIGVPKDSTIGGGEGALSDDDSLIPITGGGRLITINPLTGEQLGSVAWSGDSARATHSGEFVVTVRSGEVRAWSRDLSKSWVLTTSFGGPHGDVAIDDAGEDIFVMNNANGVRSFRVRDGKQTQMLPAGTAWEYGHVGARSRVKGEVILTNHNTGQTAGRAGRDGVAACRTDGSGLVDLLTFGYHGGEVPYNSQPMGVPSTDGTMVGFASERGGKVGLWVVRRAA